MSEARLIIGDVRDVLATLPDASVDCIVTSPPFLRFVRTCLPTTRTKARRSARSPLLPSTSMSCSV